MYDKALAVVTFHRGQASRHAIVETSVPPLGYSLGVVLIEMLTGELPYQGDDPIATAMKRLGEPPPNPREVNPAVPEELDALVVKLLAKAPEDRYGLPPRRARVDRATGRSSARAAWHGPRLVERRGG